MYRAEIVPLLVLPLLVLPLLAGCRRDMFDQPKQKPLSMCDFFEDGASARQPPEGAVPHGSPRDEGAYPPGVTPAGSFMVQAPLPIDIDTLRRGRERFEIFCSPCHGLTGAGDGMIVERGFKRPPSFHDDRLRRQPIGYFVDVITNGFGVMPRYAVQVAPRDRWTIAAYVEALQLSQSARLSDLPPEDAARVEAIQ